MEIHRVQKRTTLSAVLFVLITLSLGLELPPLDRAPAVKDGQGAFTLPLVVQSEMLGLAVGAVLGVKILLSEAMSIVPEAIYFVNANVVDESSALYFLEYEILTPMEELESLERAAEEFISSGGLTIGFANLGVPGMQFVLGATNQATAETSSSSTNSMFTPREPDTEETIAALLDVEPGLRPKEEASRMMHLYIRSPVLFFHPNLKLAILRFAGDRSETRTEPPNWYMIDVTVLNSTLGQYIASFVHIGPINTTDTAVTTVESLVDAGELNDFLVDSDARNVTISLLPVLDNIHPEPPPSPPPGFSTVVLLVRVAAPITGVTRAVSDLIKTSGANVTTTKPGDWTVKSIRSEREGATHGPFWVDYEVVIVDRRELLLQTVGNMTTFVRTKVLDHTLWKMGMTDIRILPRKRMTRFKKYGNSGVIQSSPRTVAASIAGMVIVMVVSGWIMCLLPTGEPVERRIRGEEAREWWNRPE